jgi:hypothetical protein
VYLFGVLALCAGSWVIGANMQGKLFVALQLKVPHHFIEGCAGERTRRLEPPPTFGATKTPKTLLLNPYQLPAHGRLCRCSPKSMFEGQAEIVLGTHPAHHLCPLLTTAEMLGQVVQKASLIRFLVRRCGMLNYPSCNSASSLRISSTDPVCGNYLPWLHCWGSPVANTVRWRDG